MSLTSHKDLNELSGPSFLTPFIQSPYFYYVTPEKVCHNFHTPIHLTSQWISIKVPTLQEKA